MYVSCDETDTGKALGCLTMVRLGTDELGQCGSFSRQTALQTQKELARRGEKGQGSKHEEQEAESC